MLNKIRNTWSEGGAGLVKKKALNKLDVVKFRVAPKLLRPYFYYQLQRRKTPPKFLFVLSPMRSGSTLLTHILNNHPEVSGTIEHGTGYASFADLKSLIARVGVYNADYDISHQQYFLDKMVWNYDLDPAILASERSKFIFLVREPKANLTSMAKLLPDLRDPQEALRYYEQRLDYLSQTVKSINDPSRCLTVHYEDLLAHTDSVLERLARFLGVGSPFSETYTTLKETGTLRYGDPSDKIKAGAIVRNKDSGESFFAEPVVKEADLFYQEYLLTLEQHCLN